MEYYYIYNMGSAAQDLEGRVTFGVEDFKQFIPQFTAEQLQGLLFLVNAQVPRGYTVSWEVDEILEMTADGQVVYKGPTRPTSLFNNTYDNVQNMLVKQISDTRREIDEFLQHAREQSVLEHSPAGRKIGSNFADGKIYEGLNAKLEGYRLQLLRLQELRQAYEARKTT